MALSSFSTIVGQLTSARSGAIWAAFSACLILGGPAFAKECPDDDLLELLEVIDGSGDDNIEDVMRKGTDGKRAVEIIRRFRETKPECWEMGMVAESAKRNVEAFEKYLSEPFKHEHDIPEAQCKPWVSERLSTRSKSEEADDNMLLTLTDQLSHQFDEGIAPWELLSRFATDSHGSEHHQSSIRRDELPHAGSMAEIFYSTRRVEKGLCLSLNFDVSRSNEIFSLVTKILEEKNASAVETMLLEKRSLFRKLSPEEIKAIAARPKRLERFHALFERACKERSYDRPSLLMSIRKFPYYKESHGQLMDVVDKTLNHEHPPAIGSVGAAFLTGGLKARPYDGASSTQLSTVIGRRFKGGRCEYLVKDAMAPDCDPASSAFECDAKTGSFWIPRTTMVNNVLDVYRLETGFKSFGK